MLIQNKHCLVCVCPTMPCRHQGGEEVQLLLILDLNISGAQWTWLCFTPWIGPLVLTV
jgi:hypothetical protein